MGGGLRRWAAIAVVVLAAACSDGEPPRAEPTSSPTASIFLEDRERPKVEQAYEDFLAAFEAGDWAAVTDATTEDSMDYFEEVRTAAATAGPKELRELGTYGFVAATVLRAVEGPDDAGRMSTEEVVAFLARHGLLGRDGRLDLELTEPIRVFGDSAAVFVPQGNGSAWEIDFGFEGGVWKVDLSDITRIVGDTLEETTPGGRRRLEEAILLLAETISEERVPPAIWDKP